MTSRHPRLRRWPLRCRQLLARTALRGPPSRRARVRACGASSAGIPNLPPLRSVQAGWYPSGRPALALCYPRSRRGARGASAPPAL